MEPQHDPCINSVLICPSYRVTFRKRRRRPRRRGKLKPKRPPRNCLSLWGRRNASLCVNTKVRCFRVNRPQTYPETYTVSGLSTDAVLIDIREVCFAGVMLRLLHVAKLLCSLCAVLRR